MKSQTQPETRAPRGGRRNLLVLCRQGALPWETELCTHDTTWQRSPPPPSCPQSQPASSDRRIRARAFSYLQAFLSGEAFRPCQSLPMGIKFRIYPKSLMFYLPLVTHFNPSLWNWCSAAPTGDLDPRNVPRIILGDDTSAQPFQSCMLPTFPVSPFPSLPVPHRKDQLENKVGTRG